MNHPNDILKATAIFAVVLLFGGCRTNKDILNDYEKALTAGNYVTPIAELEQKAADGGVDELMWRLHAAGSRYLTNDFEPAVAQFDQAEDIFLANDRTGVFKQGTDGAFAMITNDRAFPYAGGGEDRIFACFYKAVDYLRMNRPEAARTELNRAAQHQDNWLYERKKEIAEAEERLREDADAYAKKNGGDAGKGADAEKSRQTVSAAFSDSSFTAQIQEQCGFDARRDGNLETLARKDWLNRYVQYVTGVFRWAAGDKDGVNYLRELAAICPENPLFAADAAAMARAGRPKNQVWVFVEDGLCPMREEHRLDLPLILIPYANRYVMYAGMALPYLRYRSAACTSYTVQFTAGERPLVEIQDVDQLLKTEFDVYFRGALAREITRTVVKIGVQVALGVVAENCSDSRTKLALKLSQLGTAAWAAAVTQADLRSWTGLPQKVYAQRLTRPADGKLRLLGNGQPVAEVELPVGNAMVFVRKAAAGAPAVVKTAVIRRN